MSHLVQGSRPLEAKHRVPVANTEAMTVDAVLLISRSQRTTMSGQFPSIGMTGRCRHRMQNPAGRMSVRTGMKARTRLSLAALTNHHTGTSPVLRGSRDITPTALDGPTSRITHRRRMSPSIEISPLCRISPSTRASRPRLTKTSRRTPNWSARILPTIPHSMVRIQAGQWSQAPRYIPGSKIVPISRRRGPLPDHQISGRSQEKASRAMRTSPDRNVLLRGPIPEPIAPTRIPEIYPIEHRLFIFCSARRSILVWCSFIALAMLTSMKAASSTTASSPGARGTGRSPMCGATCRPTWTATTWHTCRAVTAAGLGRRSAQRQVATPPVSSFGGTNTFSHFCAPRIQLAPVADLPCRIRSLHRGGGWLIGIPVSSYRITIA